jgi:MinD superfamily P-loop ATPase
MKEVVVLSGKGGTGKTSIVGSFAALAKNKVMVDCDVDAADLHLLLQPVTREKHEFWSGQVASIDEERCTRCGLCQDLCRFQAIVECRVDPFSCEGCGFCSHICPVEAIIMKDNLAGHWFVSDTRYGELVHARLTPAQENSGKLVAMVRQQARELAENRGKDFIIIDGPPGIGCPVISSLSGANIALLVTEPTLTGIHDLKRVLGVCEHFGVPSLVCINKFDINQENSNWIENFCFSHGIEIAGRIGFDRTITEAMVQGMPVVEYKGNGVSKHIEELWDLTVASLNK